MILGYATYFLSVVARIDSSILKPYAVVEAAVSPLERSPNSYTTRGRVVSIISKGGREGAGRDTEGRLMNLPLVVCDVWRLGQEYPILPRGYLHHWHYWPFSCSPSCLGGI